MDGLTFPNYDILNYGNTFSGSAKTFNYKLRPKDDKITVTMNWDYNLETEKAEEFELSEEGYLAAKAWLEEQQSL